MLKGFHDLVEVFDVAFMTSLGELPLHKRQKQGSHVWILVPSG